MDTCIAETAPFSISTTCAPRVTTRRLWISHLTMAIAYQSRPITCFSDRRLLTTALNSVAPNETLTAEQKAKIYQLSLKIWSRKEVDFTIDDLAFLKERVNKIFVSPMLCGRIGDIEGNETALDD